MKKIIILAVLLLTLISCAKDEFQPFFVYKVESEMESFTVTYMDEFGDYIQEESTTSTWYKKDRINNKQQMYLTSDDPIAKLYILIYNENHECTLTSGYGQIRTMYSH